MTKLWHIALLCFVMFCFAGCKSQTVLEKKVSDLSFTVVSPDEMSQELVEHLEERKTESFSLIYKDGENMFLAIGYGVQDGSGYSVRVNDVYMGETSICVSTTLQGPDSEQKQEKTESYPYIVLKMEMMDVPVIIDM